MIDLFLSLGLAALLVPSIICIIAAPALVLGKYA
jgi:hypothetical protein